AETFPDNFTYKPSKIAADAMIARVYLSMRKYSEAEVYADSALTIKNDLIDFNNLDTNSTIPIGFSSIETLYYIEGNSQYYKLTISVPSLGSYSVDSNLLQSYSENDLRFSIFFQKNNYNGYLTRREIGRASCRKECRAGRSQYHRQRNKNKAALIDTTEPEHR